MSAWIEIGKTIEQASCGNVALLVSAWIEMLLEEYLETPLAVALLVSAWIEITHLMALCRQHLRRTPRECVD